MHILVEEGKPSKEVPCVTCGEMCRVHAYAATKWVKCPRHMKQKTRAEKRSTVLDPFVAGLDFEARAQRAKGAILDLHRVDGAVEWGETITVTGLRSFDEETGVIDCFAYGGTAKPQHDRITGHEECGQFVVIEQKEITACR